MWRYIYRELASLGQLVLVAPEGEGLGDVSAGPGKLYGKLLDCTRVLGSSLWCPDPSRGVASPLQGVNVTPVTDDDLPGSQPRHQTAPALLVLAAHLDKLECVGTWAECGARGRVWDLNDNNVKIQG